MNRGGNLTLKWKQIMMIDAEPIPVERFISLSAQPLFVPWLSENLMVPGMIPS